MAKENRMYFEVMIVEIMLNKTDLRQLKYYEERDFFSSSKYFRKEGMEINNLSSFIFILKLLPNKLSLDNRLNFKRERRGTIV